MIIVIDNYDSFTYNLVQYLGELGGDVLTFRNDQITVGALREHKPEAIVISPGPCTPNEAGISLQICVDAANDCPILGVCLGMQAMVQAYGGVIIHAGSVMHGKTSLVCHQGDFPLFKDIPDPFPAARYHSLIVDEKTLPECFSVIAHSKEDEQSRSEIMAVVHKEKPLMGVQFHPESILTECGKDILKNFVNFL